MYEKIITTKNEHKYLMAECLEIISIIEKSEKIIKNNVKIRSELIKNLIKVIYLIGVVKTNHILLILLIVIHILIQ